MSICDGAAHLPEDAWNDPILCRWAHDGCHVLAIALHRMTGWPLVTLHDGRFRGSGRFLDEHGMLVHSGVACPDGHFLDIRGLHDEASRLVIADHYMHDPDMWAYWTFEGEFDNGYREEDLLDVLPLAADALDAAIAEANDVIAGRLMPLLVSAGGNLFPAGPSDPHDALGDDAPQP